MKYVYKPPKFEHRNNDIFLKQEFKTKKLITFLFGSDFNSNKIKTDNLYVFTRTNKFHMINYIYMKLTFGAMAIKTFQPFYLPQHTIYTTKSFTSPVTSGAGAYTSGLCSVKRMRVFDSPWMGHYSPSQDGMQFGNYRFRKNIFPANSKEVKTLQKALCCLFKGDIEKHGKFFLLKQEKSVCLKLE